MKSLAEIIIIVALALLCSCKSNEIPTSLTGFKVGEVLGIVSDPNLNEISGIAASTQNPNCFWVHNDSGDKARIFLINSNAQTIATVVLTNIAHRDWEEITTATDRQNGITYIYLSETGDNHSQYNKKYIYKFPEPYINTQTLNQVICLSVPEKITFQYEDGNRDAEALFVEARTGDIYVISKREKKVGVYQLPYPQSTSETMIAKKLQTLNINKVTASDISDDGSEILIKNYDNIYYWKRTIGHSIAQTLTKEPVIIPYTWEPQGEAIAWLNDGSAFVTISEKGRENIPPKLFIYRKN